MAEAKRKRMSEDDRKFWVNTGLKVAGGLILLKYISDKIPGTDPGITDRVKYDYDKTQQSVMWVGKSEEYPTGWYVYDSPWTPEDVARRIHTAFRGLCVGCEAFERMKEITNMPIDRLRWLHNYWLDEIDSDDTLYRWVLGEWTVIGGTKKRVKKRLVRAGIGF